MYNMFQPKDLESISYFLLYGSYHAMSSEPCFAVILMPNARLKERINLQSIQFAFNQQGQVVELGITYSGGYQGFKDIAKDTQAGIVRRKVHYGRGEFLCVFDVFDKTLKLQLDANVNSTSYLSDILEFLEQTYLMKPQFAEDLTEMLLDQGRLVQEFERLRGSMPTGPVKASSCIIL